MGTPTVQADAHDPEEDVGRWPDMSVCVCVRASAQGTSRRPQQVHEGMGGLQGRMRHGARRHHGAAAQGQRPRIAHDGEMKHPPTHAIHHTHTLSLSLSLSHTHTHAHARTHRASSLLYLFSALSTNHQHQRSQSQCFRASPKFACWHPEVYVTVFATRDGGGPRGGQRRGATATAGRGQGRRRQGHTGRQERPSVWHLQRGA